jgi:hypothetical protein
MLHLILVLLALLLFLIAIFPVPSRFNLIAAGLFCWLLAETLGSLHP